MKTPALIVTMIGIALLIAAASPQDEAGVARKGPQEESARRIKELKKEKIAALNAMLEVVTAQRQAAQATSLDVSEATIRLRQAEADAAEQESDRLKLYEEIVELTKKQDEIADRLWKSGQAPYTAAANAKVKRYDAEITLEQAKAKSMK